MPGQGDRQKEEKQQSGERKRGEESSRDGRRGAIAHPPLAQSS
jgi:hypothetical protein